MLKFSAGKTVVVVVFGLARPIPIGADVPAIAFGVGTGDDAVRGWRIIGGCVGWCEVGGGAGDVGNADFLAAHPVLSDF